MPRLLLCCLAALLLAPALAAGAKPSPPQLSSIAPNNGPQAGGNTVTIDGVALQGESPVSAVSFGGRPASSFQVESDTRITAVAPPGNGEAAITVSNGRGESSQVVPDANYGYDPPPEGPWLGLNGNSSQFLGPVDAFVDRRVAYDRSGPVEVVAGETLARVGHGLETSLKAGMIPVIPIEYPAYGHCHFGQQCLPTTAPAITQYVRGFISIAREILARWPAAPIMLEATNEPWGYGSASQYAAILASLLPAARRANLPIDRIYAGANERGSWIKSLYAARPRLRTEVQGWYFHPYNHERGKGEGVAGLPGWQAEMTSGQNNVIVSEIGFCAPEVNRSRNQCQSGPAPANSAREAASMLGAELRKTVPFHRAGWLRAVIVYSRNDGGWAMQLRGGALTAQGRALDTFAARYG